MMKSLTIRRRASPRFTSARHNLLQRAVNICLGPALATIALTIPAVLAIGRFTDRPVELGRDSPGIVVLSVTLLVSIMGFATQRTNLML
ncbi:MAG: hypothetical protein GDA49_00155 [Rhodospirillales bacterium]|nr:hypothetical protein [Rhodospirillales bacterium]